MTYASQLETAIGAAVAAGDLLLQQYEERLAATRKESLRDIVTVADLQAEDLIVNRIRARHDGAVILTEERGRLGEGPDAERWVVDALDGTVNYVNQVPIFAVSIAYVVDDRPVVGAVFNPMAADLYYGGEGLGVFKNQVRLAVHDKPPEECLFAAAFSGKAYEPTRRSEEFLLLGEVNDGSRGCLRTGSAAMNLAYLAEGRLGGCWGKANKIWDVAAGLLLAEMAGARVHTEFMDADRCLVGYVASVPAAWDFLRERAGSRLGLDGR